MKNYLILFLKGLAMGAANVIPGVSGGTIALITGIFERLINAIKAFDIEAVRMLFKGQIKALWQKVDGTFLVAVFAGIAISILSVARLFKSIMESESGTTLLMAFFFGLILVSIFTVGATVKKWSISSIIALILGLIIAVGIALINPAQENAAFWYLMICGVVAMCSMILPGLSGSFVLIILGNYKLVMVDAVSDLNINILIPVAIGAVAGLLAFSRILAWVFARYHDMTIALMTGFIAGSLVTIWPWKTPIRETFGEKIKVVGYEGWNMPDFGDTNTFYAIGLIILGGAVIWGMEKASKRFAD
jgi:putative membrane protein